MYQEVRGVPRHSPWFLRGEGNGYSHHGDKSFTRVGEREAGPDLLGVLRPLKLYENLYCGCLLQTLEDYRLGPKMRGIMAEFWVQQLVVTQTNCYHVPQSRATHGTTQVRLVFPTLFNVEVERVVRHWMSVTVEDDVVIQNRLGHVVGRSFGVFYADNDILSLQDPAWLQGSLNILIGLFHRIGLMYNVAKSTGWEYWRRHLVVEVRGKVLPTGNGCGVVCHTRTAGWILRWGQ